MTTTVVSDDIVMDLRDHITESINSYLEKHNINDGPKVVMALTQTLAAGTILLGGDVEKQTEWVVSNFRSAVEQLVPIMSDDHDDTPAQVGVLN